MYKYVFTLPVSFRGSCTPRMSQILLGKIIRVILQKKEGVYKSVNFKDFSRPNKDIKYFFKDLNRIQGLFKTTSKIQDLFKTERTLYNRNRKQR